ncbi:hypothetical protein RFI_08655 [Reticulomyxa filosa]|uniref:TLC domain-containing protein n=1 Tax=Reticulomyxa filosa TaxID=46433 RepID=X6NT44_RETFI|nr:hypothetical protein RFI_08655 [Reticulomyxa filosa]|eukprot:ETO28477.1 hypothetical protein RFI_08655 [Reticulomyxa filosa]
MPKFAEMMRDKSKLELLNEVTKLKNFKRLANLKARDDAKSPRSPRNEIKNEANASNVSHTTYKEDFQSWLSSLSSFFFFFLNTPFFIKKNKNAPFLKIKKKKARSGKQFPMKKLSEETGLSEKEIIGYWKYNYTTQQKKELMEKYLEELWKCLTVGFNSFYGCYVMWNQASFWHSELLWKQFPQIETPSMTLFYGLGIGYHLHRAVFQFFDHQRKDFLAMVLHHWTTVGLIWFSWHYGLTECGTIVMFCHDATDFLLAAGKVCAYHHSTFFKEVIFALFVSHWILVRMLLFAKKVVITSTIDTVPSHSCHWAWYFFIPGLWVLLFLHFYWLTFIFGVIYRKVFLKKSVVDNRSDSDTWQEE